MKLILRLVVSAVALWVAAEILAKDGPIFGADQGIELADDRFSGPWFGTLILVAVIFGVINAVLQPIIKTVGCAAYALTLGLLALIVNGALLLLTSWIGQELFNLGFEVDGFLTAVLGALIIGLVSWLLNMFVKNAR
jgi:putative membrane protein